MDFLSRMNAPRVLVAESSPDQMAHLSSIVEQAGYNVQKAYNTGDALYALYHTRFDIALVNARMSDQDGHPLSTWMEQFPVRWIALVEAGTEDARRYINRGASAMVSYTIPPAELLSRIEGLLQGQTPVSTTPKNNAESDEMRQMLERKLLEQRALSALARSLSSVLDLDALLTQVVDAAVSLCRAEEGMLLLPDEDGKALYLRAFKGLDSETARNFRIKTQDTLAGQVFHTGKPFLVGDQGWQKVKTEYLVKSLLYVPLSSKGQIIGVLGLNNKNAERAFTENDIVLLEDLAAHAAIAIENARLYEESVLRTRELSMLVQAGEAANSTLSIDHTLSVISGHIMGALDVGQCYIGEWDHKELKALSARYRAIWQPADAPALPINKALEQAFDHKRSMVSHAPLSTELSLHTQARSAVHVPISADNRPLGVVSFYYTHTENPDPALVSQISFQQQAMEALVNLSDARRQQKNLFRAAQKMLEIAKADWCDIAIWDGARNGFYVMLAYGEAIWHDERRPSIILNQLPQLGQMLDTQTPFTGSLLDQQDQRRLLELGRGKSFLALPLVIKGKTAGLVFLTDTLYHRHFSRREVELAQALILQAANALDNARLFRDLELSLLELRRTQSKLVQTARLTAMGELAAAIAHQINNPLTTILGDAELLLQDITPEDSTYESLEAISRAGRRAHEVVRRLLGMARQQPLEDIIEAVDVNDTINNTLALVRSHIQQGSVGLDVQLGDQIPAVVGIRGQLEDVWLNLLMNARDAVVGRPKPRIGISTRQDSGESRVVIEVWDNGVGIPTEIQQQVFEPFFTTKPTGEGTGLGLHICHQVVEKCGGSITVQSTYNEGTRFIIYLPLFTRRVGI